MEIKNMISKKLFKKVLELNISQPKTIFVNCLDMTSEQVVKWLGAEKINVDKVYGGN